MEGGTKANVKGCMRWHRNLVDTSNFSEGVQDLYIRVDAIDLAEYQKSRGCLAKKGMLSILVVPNARCFDTLLHFLWMLVFKEEEKM